MAELNNPDDKLFRAVFSRPEITAELIRQCAPASLVEILDLDTLHLSDASFVDEEMKEHFADLVFSCKLKDGQPVVVPLVIEHKSYVPPYAPYQILRYQVQGWSRQIRDKETPTPIIPVIFYHGKEKWEVRPWKDYLSGMKPSLETYTPAWSYVFIDLSEMPDERILDFRNNFMKTVMLLMKHRREREFLLNHLGEIIIFVEETVGTGSGRDDLLMVIRYLTATAPLNRQELNEILTRRSESKNAVMTIYESLIAEGKQEGIQEGIELVAKKMIPDILKMMPHLTDEKIAEMGNFPIQLVRKIREEMKKKRHEARKNSFLRT